MRKIHSKAKLLIILSITPYFGIQRFVKAYKNKINLKKLITRPNEYKKDLRLHKKSIAFLASKEYSAYLEKVKKWYQNKNCHIISFLDKEYPNKLKEIFDPPLLIYAVGNVTLLNSKQIAIVGSRHPSTYGKEVTQNIVADLVKNKLTITSGLAQGIDSLSHQNALDNKGNTLAVMGTGINKIYPAKNRKLATKIVQKNSLIISEYPLDTEPLRHNFPQRNRIISALSLGTVIIEAQEKSGSLITAKLAIDQNKEVFAIPGSIFNKNSLGCNNLIKEGAKLVNCVDDILEELSISSLVTSTPTKDSLTLSLNSDQLLVFDVIKFDTTPLDHIINTTKLSYEDVNSILFELEFEGVIESVAGGYVKK